eukprot:8655256-Prorocentrum_lima.AAC.1
MTSSLVGSEMCIRDRDMSVVSVQRVVQSTQVEEQDVRTTVKTSLNTNTVSYTHLTLPTICSV